jgi:predicted ArsR family transcriptional regulator
MHCPFRDLAEANPTVVCGLHRGLVQGFVDEMGDAQVLAFRSLVDRDGCQVDIDVLSPA